MFKRTLLTMTALSSLVLVSAALHDTAMAGQFIKPRPSIRIATPQLKARIDTRRLATRKDAKKRAVSAAQAADVPPANAKTKPPTRRTPSVQQVADVPPLPRPRPYDEAGNDAGVGPDTDLPSEDNLFDENQIAAFPAFWGENAIDVLEGLGHGALDRAFENAPDPVDPFAPGNYRPGDLAVYEPGGHVQPGGPNDPNARDQVPSFFNDPFNRNGNDDSQGWSSPSQAFGDRSGWASDGGGGSSAGHSWWEGRTHRTTVVSGDGTTTETSHTDNPAPGIRSITIFSARRENGSSMDIEKTVRDDGSYSIVGYIDHDDGTTTYLNLKYDSNGNLVDSETRRGETPLPTVDDSAPDSQPGIDPSTQEEAAGQAWICNNTPWMCRGGGGGSTPNEMLTQPGQPGDGANSIMDTDDGPALGREAVTNSGDPEWNLEGNGGGGGSSSTPDEMLGQPGSDDGPGGPIG